ncbi:hypothetical protein ACVB8X_37605 [Streptomyces sp. NRAIS4]
MADPNATRPATAEPGSSTDDGGRAEELTPREERLHKAAQDFSLERYKYILQQIHAVNENVYKFLAIYQALATTAVGAAVALFVSYRQWGMAPEVARTGVIGLLLLETVVAVFTEILIFIGILNWLDYRSEECELTDRAVHPGFRKQPRPGNFFRWYETYIMAFIVVSTLFMWTYAVVFMLPMIR